MGVAVALPTSRLCCRSEAKSNMVESWTVYQALTGQETEA